MDDITPDLVCALAARRESSHLDFKAQQYDWAREGNHEFAKDLMAIGNSLMVHSQPGYILIGVKESQDDRTGIIEGISLEKHLDDGIMQEKVKGLVNRVPKFSYSVVNVDEKLVGVIAIRPGARPFYALRASVID
jgi:predicted HTH transcriptional regulator